MAMLKDKKTLKPNIGLQEEELEGLNAILAQALGTEVTLSYKTKKYHWNVTGPQFQELHELFDQQYNQLQVIVDDIAEYIRQYGEFSPGTLKEFTELSWITENPGYNPPAMEMVSDLVASHEEIIRKLRRNAKIAAEKYNDPQVEDLFVGFIHQHQKMAWFLRGHLEDNNFE